MFTCNYITDFLKLFLADDRTLKILWKQCASFAAVTTVSWKTAIAKCWWGKFHVAHGNASDTEC